MLTSENVIRTINLVIQILGVLTHVPCMLRMTLTFCYNKDSL